MSRPNRLGDVLQFLDGSDDDGEQSAHCPTCGATLEFRVHHEWGRLEERCPACAGRGGWQPVRPRVIAPPVAGGDETDDTARSIGGLTWRSSTRHRRNTPQIAAAVYDAVPRDPAAAIAARTIADALDQPIEVICHILGRFADEGAMRREQLDYKWHYWRVK